MHSRTLVLMTLFSGGLAGCSGPFVGTWLFQYDMSSRQFETSCSDESEVEYIGDQLQWVDMYETAGGALVFTNGDYDLVGVDSGQSFDVSGVFGEQLGSSFFEWKLDIKGTLNGKDLTGESDLKEIFGADGSECQSRTKIDFIGVKMRVDDANPTRSIGTQSSQTATANE